MQPDEEEIRNLVTAWLAATKAGDVETVLSLMADDVVFLVPGQPVMRKAEFAAAAKSMSGPNAPQFDGKSEIQEIQICGDWAFMWTKLTVVVTPPGAAQRYYTGREHTFDSQEAGHQMAVGTRRQFANNGAAFRQFRQFLMRLRVSNSGVQGCPGPSGAQDPPVMDRFGAAPPLYGPQDRHADVVIQRFGDGPQERQAH